MSDHPAVSDAEQLSLPWGKPAISRRPAAATSERSNGQLNKLNPSDRAFHSWYRFVLSYPPHLVRDYIRDFGLKPGQTVLDPFCGTGTTLVEAMRQGLASVGLEANLFPRFASAVKVDWSVDPEQLGTQAYRMADEVRIRLAEEGIDDDHSDEERRIDPSLRALDPDAGKLLLTDSISPLPLHKTLTLLDELHRHQDAPYYRHALLALANALVYKISNLHFGPEVGVQNPKRDAPVLSAWLSEIDRMVADLAGVRPAVFPSAVVHAADARRIGEILSPQSVDAVITSPPYPNEKDYTRTTRLESVLLGFIRNREELRALKKTLIRSNTRGVYKEDDDDRWIAGHPEIQRIAEAIEGRRIELGKDSGFERMYGRVARLYFGGMARHLADLRTVLKPGAQLAYVVGDQASYLRVMIRTGQLLSEIAGSLGYEPVRIDLFRTRLATATREQLREEVVVLRWPG